jgi:hypothetical protein
MQGTSKKKAAGRAQEGDSFICIVPYGAKRYFYV